MKFFKENPYILIFITVIGFASILFGWGKIFRDLEWYLDKTSLILSLIFSIIGLGLSGILLYYRNHSQDKANS